MLKELKRPLSPLPSVKYSSLASRTADSFGEEYYGYYLSFIMGLYCMFTYCYINVSYFTSDMASFSLWGGGGGGGGVGQIIFNPTLSYLLNMKLKIKNSESVYTLKTIYLTSSNQPQPPRKYKQ